MTMRKEMLEIKDQKQVNQFLKDARIGHLGLSDEGHPYVVPLNFVYWKNAIYFHGADEGRKVEVMDRNKNVCFTVDEEYGTLVDPVPAKTDTAYMSVMIFGTVERVEDLDEATMVMQDMLDKYVPGYYDKPLSKNHVKNYRSSLHAKAAIFKITTTKMSAKSNKLNENLLFSPGRTIDIDIK